MNFQTIEGMQKKKKENESASYRMESAVKESKIPGGSPVRSLNDRSLDRNNQQKSSTTEG